MNWLRNLHDPSTVTTDFIHFSEFGPVVDLGLDHGTGGGITGEARQVGPSQYGYVITRRFRSAPADTGGEVYLLSSQTQKFERVLRLENFGEYHFEFIPQTGGEFYDLQITVEERETNETFQQRYRYTDGAYAPL